jgi:hypothetical protein
VGGVTVFGITVGVAVIVGPEVTDGVGDAVIDTACFFAFPGAYEFIPGLPFPACGTNNAINERNAAMNVFIRDVANDSC